MDKFKYPRTPHLPWSPGISSDDEVLDISPWSPLDSINVTMKMDGENTTIGPDYVHARSLDSGYHLSRTWVKKFASDWQWDLNEDERICGENMYARHSIAYDNLESFFLGFSYWTGDWCHSWKETEAKFAEYGIVSVPVLFDSVSFVTLSTPLQKGTNRSSWFESEDRYKDREGYVVRSVDGFSYNEFSQNVAKYVRAHHVKTDGHWMHEQVGRNSLASELTKPA